MIHAVPVLERRRIGAETATRSSRRPSRPTGTSATAAATTQGMR